MVKWSRLFRSVETPEITSCKEVSGWEGSCRERTSKSNHNTDFHRYLLFLKLESPFLKQQMNTQNHNPQIRWDNPAVRLDEVRSAHEAPFHPSCASARGSAASPVLAAGRAARCLCGAQREPQGCCQKSRAHPQTTRVHAALCNSLVPNYGEFARCADPRGPKGTLGQHHRAQPPEQRALTWRTKHKQLGLKAITRPWMFSTGSLASGRT